MSQLARVALLAVVGAEGLAALERFRARQVLYDAAAARARALGRPLVVVGDPDAGMHTRLARAYGCGDVCVDLTGCPACPTGVAADLTRPNALSERVPTNTAVVFVACVFEYVPDVQAAWAEVKRMAGDPANVFVATVQPVTITAVAYPDAHWRVIHAPPDGTDLVVEPVTTGRKLAYGAALAALAYAALG